MKKHFGIALSGRKKLLLATVGVAALVVPVCAGMRTSPALHVQSSSGHEWTNFDVVSIKVNKSGNPGTRINLSQPGGYFAATNATLRDLIASAYFLGQVPNIRFLVFGTPDWGISEHFDIEARAEGNPTLEQKKLMVQSLLADRFRLVMHNETRQLPVYALVLVKAGKTGPQLLPDSDHTKCFDLTAAEPPASSSAPLPPCDSVNISLRSGHPTMVGDLTMERFAAYLSGLVGHLVVDRTELSGTFGLTMDYTPEVGQPGARSSADAIASDPSAPASIFTSLQEQLGLKLESQTGPVNVLVIDHVEEPSPN